MIEAIFSAIGNFFKRHPRYIFLFFIFSAAVYLRSAYLASSAYFLGIASADQQIVAKILQGNLAFLGAPFPFGGFSLGPVYEYLIAIPIWLMGPDPIQPALFSALLFVATVYLLYIVGKQFFNKEAGIFAAGVYAVSSFTISYVYQSWQIDMLPFFALLLLWAIFRAAASARPWLYYLFAGYLLGICLQLHYAAFFVPFLMVLYLLITEIVVKGKKFFVSFLLHTVELLGGFVLCSFPFLYFETVKGFPNILAFGTYLSEAIQQVNFVQLALLLPQLLYTLFARFLVHFPSTETAIYYTPGDVTLMGYFALFLLVLSFLVLFFFARNKFVILLLFFWLFFGLGSFGLFQGAIYEYHFSLLYPVCALLVGNLLATIFHLFWHERVKMEKQLISQTSEGETYTMIPVDATDKSKLALHITSIVVSIILFGVIVLFNLSVIPHHASTQEQQAQVTEVASFIMTKVEKNSFNFALVPKAPNTADPSAYEIEFKRLGNKPLVLQHLEIDPELKTVGEYLYVVCEEACKPLDSARWDIKGFGKAAILDHWDVNGTTVYKLVHVIERF
jgi:4-amino-4-deoxy-L-arabinose transferase-like glycosyltransferase